MRYIKGEERSQTVLFPESLDDYISDNNPVRFIEAFVDKLDMLKLEFTHAETKETGRKPYNPKDLLKLYLYGYMNKTRSSRLLEKLTHQNIEVIWLLKKLKPDFKTIADFRRDNSKAIKSVFREFIMLCRHLGVIGGSLVAVDGSKFRAQNSKSRNFTQKQIKSMMEKAEQEVNQYLNQLDNNDINSPEASSMSKSELQEKIKLLQSSMAKYQEYLDEMDVSGEKQISTTDPDSKLMLNHGTKEVSFNAQIAVDSKSKMIVANDVSNDCNDLNQLHRMGLAAKDVLGVDRLEVVADTGYYNPISIKICDDNNVDCYVAKPNYGNCFRQLVYPASMFKYNHLGDYFVCPAGHQLHHRTYAIEYNKYYKVYKTKSCKDCVLRNKCTTSKRGGRKMRRWVHEDVLEKMNKYISYKKELIAMRKAIVEHPFGTLKRTMNQSYFLCKGLQNVQTEFTLSSLAYNIKRLLNIMDFGKLKAVMSMLFTKFDQYLNLIVYIKQKRALLKAL